MKRLDLGFEPYARAVARKINICSPRQVRVPENPFPSPGGYIKLNADEPPTPMLALPWTQASKIPVKTPWWKKALKVFCWTSVWWIAAIQVILEIKHTVKVIFPYPFALTALIQPSTAVCAWILSFAVYRNKPPPPQFTWQESSYLLLFGGLQGVEIGLTNKALQYLTVASRTMISSTGVLFMMCTARFWGLERLGVLRLCSGFMMILGGFFQCEGAQVGTNSDGQGDKLQLLGVVMQAVSMFFSSQRWALAQFVLQHSPKGSALAATSKLGLLARTLPLTGLVSALLSFAFETDAFVLSRLENPELLLRVGFVAASLTGMLYAELKLVSLLSAVAFNVLSTIHQIPIVIAGVIVQQNQVSLLSASGFGCCLAGALIYAAARHADKEQE
eukprot:TRINITY_DN67483_c0_g1_i1.p1 TRINITY_DN67483_c0_g1~~TRINITY_DN67483_c0_g1_i1.p1  ORF type:complete len:389 (+),score=47.31 TRINITY_DN67483_c0_g1_i1:132-1298(+)